MTAVGVHYVSAVDFETLVRVLPDICVYHVLDDSDGKVIGLRFYSPDGHRESRVMKGKDDERRKFRFID